MLKIENLLKLFLAPLSALNSLRVLMVACNGAAKQQINEISRAQICTAYKFRQILNVSTGVLTIGALFQEIFIFFDFFLFSYV